MEFLKRFGIDGMQLIKVLGFVLLGLAVLVALLGVTGIERGGWSDVRTEESVGSMAPGYPSAPMYDGAELSIRNVADSYMPPIPSGYTPGDDAEAFEVREYNAYIETRNVTDDCAAIFALKTRTDVIFENTNEYDRGCSYTFKVKKNSVAEILQVVKGLSPKELSENTYTIKREVSDYTSEVEILENKLASLDSTLAEAIASYTDITALATRIGDVESLAKIIESKLTIIERLTFARIETGNQLERVNRAKADALDRLEYTYFSVNISENKFIDKDAIEDSWKQAMQKFVREINFLIQEITIGFISLLLTVMKFALYFFVLLFVAKYGWVLVQRVWKE